VSSALATQPEPAPVAKVSQPGLTNTMLLMGACSVLLMGPLAFGAVEPWSIFALEACSVLLFCAWSYRQWNNHQLNISDHALYRPMTVFFALVVVQCLTGTSVYRYVTDSRLLLLCAYGMLAFVVTQSLRRYSQFETMAKLITAYGGIVAAFAVLQGIAPNGKLYWTWSVEQGGAIYGPYVNHNHYAGLMEMLTPFPLVLAASQLTNGYRKIAFTGISALMAASIFLSGSRGGMAAFVSQMIVLAALLMRKRDGGWKQPLMLAAFLAAVMAFLIWLGGNELTQRLVSIHSEAHQEISGGLRLSIDRDCLHMLVKKPILGWGLGTFPVVFVVNQAHDDYLQLLIETGLAGFAIAVWFLVVVFRKAAGKLKNWTTTSTGALTVAALLGCVGILVHSFLDFNLQIPANAALFYVLCALAASNPLQESTRKRTLRRHSLIIETQPEIQAS
jgi:O-antigen ligase